MFDIIIGNPPYQELKPGFKKSNTIWHNFVMKAIENNSKNGFVSLIHPSGWRNVDGRFKNAQRHIMSNDILYLEMHSIKDGIKTFGATTPYDWYVLRNTKTDGLLTEIKCIDGTSESRCLDNWEFIPGGMFDEVFSLMVKPNEEKTEVLHNSSYHIQRNHVSKEKTEVLYSRSAYGSDKKHINKEKTEVIHSYSAYESRKDHVNKKKTEEFIYPCIMNVNVKGEISKMYWSNTNKNGHFGIPKVIFGRKVCGTLIDADGQYGLAEDATGIVDIPENLPMIKSALDSKNFIKLMKYCDCGGTQDRYNRKVIALFRKNFWREFI